MTPEELARLFHSTYERLAPDFNYRTREASAVPWDEVPEQNRNLMIAVATEVLAALGETPGIAVALRRGAWQPVEEPEPGDFL